MYLIFDTETTGFFNPKVSSFSPIQARCCSIAAIVMDSEFNEVNVLHELIKPTGWKINPGAFAQHGITVEMCEEQGKPIDEVMQRLIMMAGLCHYKVAHNIEFDNNMLDVEYDNCSDSLKAMGQKRDHIHVCTMNEMTDVMQLPLVRKNAFGKKFKWPKLREAYEYCNPMGTPFKEHDALNDVRACASVFKWMVQQGKYKLPIVLNPEYAKASIEIGFDKPTSIHIGGTPNA